MKKTLSEKEEMKLVGLFYLADQYYSHLKEVETAIEELLELTSADYPCTILNSAIYKEEDFDAKSFCKKHNIKIQK